MNELETREIFEHAGAIKEGHFILRGDDHSKWYVDKNIISHDPGSIRPRYATEETLVGGNHP